jgi:hypothetical protein
MQVLVQLLLLLLVLLLVRLLVRVRVQLPEAFHHPLRCSIPDSEAKRKGREEAIDGVVTRGWLVNMKGMSLSVLGLQHLQASYPNLLPHHPHPPHHPIRYPHCLRLRSKNLVWQL